MPNFDSSNSDILGQSKTGYSKQRIINPKAPEPGIISEAADILKESGKIIFPTAFLYGLGVDPFNSSAVEAVFKIKKRTDKKPILILIRDINELTGLVEYISPDADKLINQYWPGNITLVFRGKDIFPAGITDETGKVGIRLTDNKIAAAIINRLGGPITGTSANLSGSPGSNKVSNLHDEISDSVDLILDAGTLKKGSGSTVIDATVSPPMILRQGEAVIDLGSSPN